MAAKEKDVQQKMEFPSKFIQIACRDKTLFALDDEGRVWYWLDGCFEAPDNAFKWHRMGDKRKVYD